MLPAATETVSVAGDGFTLHVMSGDSTSVTGELLTGVRTAAVDEVPSPVTKVVQMSSEGISTKALCSATGLTNSELRQSERGGRGQLMFQRASWRRLDETDMAKEVFYTAREWSVATKKARLRARVYSVVA